MAILAIESSFVNKVLTEDMNAHLVKEQVDVHSSSKIQFLFLIY